MIASQWLLSYSTAPSGSTAADHFKSISTDQTQIVLNAVWSSTSDLLTLPQFIALK